MNVTTMTGIILGHYDRATPDQRHDGMTWYATAQATVDAMARASGHSRETCAGVVAALSPRNPWKRNVAMAWALLEDREVKGLGRSIAKARAIISGTPPLEVLGAKAWKTQAFYANLLGYEDTFVTVDTWAVRAVGWPEADLSNERVYGDVRAAYEFAAVARGIRAAQMQAVVWVVVRGSAV